MYDGAQAGIGPLTQLAGRARIAIIRFYRMLGLGSIITVFDNTVLTGIDISFLSLKIDDDDGTVKGSNSNSNRF